MTATARSHSAWALIVGAACVLLAVQAFAPGTATAQGGEGHTVSPLPASDYSVRSVCQPPAPGYASCLALELVPQTPAARAHSHPLGMTQKAGATGSQAAGACEPPIPADGCWGLRPQDLHSAYKLPTTSASAQTIALVDAYDDPTAEKDLAVYDEEFDLPACTKANGCFTKVNEQGERQPLPEPNGAAAVEISLDVEIAHATCENCRILLVEAQSLKYSDLETAENRAVALGATEISNSWYGSEPITDSAAFDHPGTVITAAAGDYGYLNWGFTGEPGPEEIEQGAANYPASSPHVIAVGGTRLELSGPANEWETETVWNGEGATGSGCGGFAAPPWQLQTTDWSTVGCGSQRAVADVAADADPYTGVAIYDSTPDGLTPPYWRTVGGTSLASPLIASAFALAGGAGGVEYPAKTLYENEVSAPASLHDVESGSDGECAKPITSEGLSGCTVPEEATSCAGEAICVAGPGYDGPSGVGTPDGIAAFEPTGEPAKAAQAIEFTSSTPEKATVGGATYTVTAEASSQLPVFFTSGTPFVCTVLDSTVSPIGAGTCTLDADQAGNATYKAAPQARQSFAVGKGSQSITFTSSAPGSATIGGATYTVTATASSGLPVSLSTETPEVCTLAGSTVSFPGTGICTITAQQAGDADYKAAPVERQSFAVGKKAQMIEFTSKAPGSATIGGATYTVTATASSGLPVSLSTETPEVCTLAGSTVSFPGTGICTITAQQAGDGEYEPAPHAWQTFAVAAAPALPPTAPIPASSTLPFTFSFTPTSVPTTTSAFTLLGDPTVNRRTGAITFTLSVDNPGTITWLLTIRNDRLGVHQASKATCAAGRIRLDGACRPAKILFAKGSVAAKAASSLSFTVKPRAAARTALKDALRRGRGIPVTATLTFQASGGAGPVSHTRLIADGLTAVGKRGSPTA
jgi:hypothetical protein